jgi:hypothetical protein
MTYAHPDIGRNIETAHIAGKIRHPAVSCRIVGSGYMPTLPASGSDPYCYPAYPMP